jgi:hypothetical protein
MVEVRDDLLAVPTPDQVLEHAKTVLPRLDVDVTLRGSRESGDGTLPKEAAGLARQRNVLRDLGRLTPS